MAVTETVRCNQQKLVEVAELTGRNFALQVFGENGPGTNVCFDEFEQLLDPVIRALVAGFLGKAVAQQAGRLGETLKCPTCQRPCSRDATLNSITALQGTCEWEEPKYYCDGCQRSFFPSAVVAEA